MYFRLNNIEPIGIGVLSGATKALRGLLKKFSDFEKFNLQITPYDNALIIGSCYKSHSS